MNDIKITVQTFDDLFDFHLNATDYSQFTLKLSSLTNPTELSTGDSVECEVIIADQEKTFSLKGSLQWKRLRDIKTPGRIIPAGIGIILDEESVEKIKTCEESSRTLSDMSEPMIAGNYIKIRRDYLTNRKETAKKDNFDEKRNQPRITVSIALEVFANEQVSQFSTQNISLDGIAFKTDDPIDLGEEMVIVFEEAEREKQFFIKGKVVRHLFDPLSKAFSGIGVQFNFENASQKKELMNFIIRNT